MTTANFIVYVPGAAWPSWTVGIYATGAVLVLAGMLAGLLAGVVASAFVLAIVSATHASIGEAAPEGAYILYERRKGDDT